MENISQTITQNISQVQALSTNPIVKLLNDVASYIGNGNPFTGYIIMFFVVGLLISMGEQKDRFTTAIKIFIISFAIAWVMTNIIK